MLSLENVSLFVGHKLLLNDAYLNITPGARMGIVGRNGSGKSHLMEMLAGTLSPDGGKIILKDGVTALLVKQELPDNDESPLDYLRNSDPDIQEAELAMTDSSGDTFGEAYTRLTELEEERYTTLAPKVLRGLGLSEEQMNAPMRNLSGGLRMRINLAQALIRTPDVLLLDEPTNHLDLESTQWLISYLQSYPKKSAVVVVSHDLAVLKKVTNSTVHLREGVLTEYSGDYESYQAQLKTREEKDIQKNKVLEKEIEQHTKIYHKFKSLPAERAAQAVQQLKKAEQKKEKLVELIVEEPVVNLDFGYSPDIRGTLINLQGVSVGYKNNTVLSNLDLSIQAGAKIGLLGRNGEGKSTFIKLLIGKLNEQKGDILRAAHLKIGYFSQDSAEELNLNSTVYAEFVAKTGMTSDSDVKSRLAAFGFPHDKLTTAVKNLSGGERSRLMFCFICTRSPNLIILDEPTNHLDVETREELAKAMKAFKGSIILISHDADLHEQTMDQFWLAQEGTVRAYTKGIQHYQGQLQKFIDSLSGSATSFVKKTSNSGKQESNSNGIASSQFFQSPAKGKHTSSKTKNNTKGGSTTTNNTSSKPGKDEVNSYDGTFFPKASKGSESSSKKSSKDNTTKPSKKGF